MGKWWWVQVYTVYQLAPARWASLACKDPCSLAGLDPALPNRCVDKQQLMTNSVQMYNWVLTQPPGADSVCSSHVTQAGVAQGEHRTDLVCQITKLVLQKTWE